jgi:hypothetical protein
MKTQTLLLIPFSAALVFGQSKTTWIGTLVDATCQNTRTERTESKETNSQRSVTTTTETRTENLDCPVTSTTNSFGIVTADGRFVRFDNPSNTRVIEIVRKDQGFNRSASDRAPMRVRVIGTATGDVAVVESLVSDARSGNADRVADAPEAIFDARYKDDRGKLVVGAQALSFEDLSDAKHSRTWTYSQIKELKREGGNTLKIEPYNGDDAEFRLEGSAMSEAVYKTIGDRIAAARAR